MPVRPSTTQPVIPPNLYSNVNEHNSLGSPVYVNPNEFGGDITCAIFETNILRVSPVNSTPAIKHKNLN